MIVLLTGLGLYAFCSYLYALRTTELAIRAGLGAGPAQISAVLLRETAKVLVLGSLIGLAASLIGQRLLSSLIAAAYPDFKLSLIALSIIAGVAISAVFVPILQAIRANVAGALRVS